MSGQQSFRAYAALIGSMLIWGLSFLATKDLIAFIPVLPLLFSRFIIASVLLGLLAWQRGAIRAPRRDLLLLAGFSLLSPVGYYLFETYGVAWTQPSHVSVIIATIPIAVYLIAFARKQEPVTWQKTLGMAVAYGGIVLIVLSSQGEQGASMVGDLLVLGAVVCAAFRTTLIKEALRRITPLQLTFYQFTFSLAVFGPLAAAEGFAWLPRLTWLHWLELLFLGVLCSAIAFLAMHYALVHLSATSVAVSANLVPVVTLFAQTALFGIPLTTPNLLGTFLAVLGVIITQLQSKQRLDVPSRTGG